MFTKSLALAAALIAAVVPHETFSCSAFAPPHASIGSSPHALSAANLAITKNIPKEHRADGSIRRWMSPVAEEAGTRQSTSVQNDPECITKPRGATNPWEVHKFGGASLATAELYRTVGDLLIREAQGRGEGGIPTMA